MRVFLALLAGAIMMIWPALLNGYPIVFSDTGGLLSMGLEPTIGWDKPWVYGPLLLALHGRTTLWVPCVAQGLIVSHVLWMLQKVTVGGFVWRHLVVCAVLAAGTAAPWFASLLMPDIFAPLTVLCLFLLAFPAGVTVLSHPERGWLVGLAAVSIGVHLSHLIVAAACLALVLALRWRRTLICAAPLGIALAALLASNIAGHGMIGISPYGSIFGLARLQADGVASAYLHDVCRADGADAAMRLCGWADRLPTDSDKFLWDPDGPVWANNYGPTLLLPEAARVVPAAIRAYPMVALQAAAANALRQAALVEVGDALAADYLDVTVLPRLQRYFPPEEATRFNAGLQARGLLAAEASPFLWPHRLVLLAGCAGSLLMLAIGRRQPVLAGLAAMALIGVAANAFATGALSGPHHRYQARIAWLVVLPPLLLVVQTVAFRLRSAARPPPDSSAPALRSRATASTRSHPA